MSVINYINDILFCRQLTSNKKERLLILLLYIICLYMGRKRMSNCNFCDTDFDTLGTNADNGATCDPISDLTLSTMVVGNQGVMLNKLIMILLFLYAYTNQNFISYLMCTNEKLIDNQACLTCKLVDNVLDALENCQSNLNNCRCGKHHSH
jgi:hypothetical protein